MLGLGLGWGWGWTRRVAAAWERAGQGRADTSQGSDAQRGDIHGAGAEEHYEAVCTRCAGERADGVESRSRRHRGRAMLASHGLRVVSPAAAHLSKRPDHGFGLSSSTQQQQTTAQTTTTAKDWASAHHHNTAHQSSTPASTQQAPPSHKTPTTRPSPCGQSSGCVAGTQAQTNAIGICRVTWPL
jgi:hypothetical protein